ncbi:hypothetical protein [Crassaminicella profunda]|uniref:hypothetical protein n=1 Tax=Crassaminicella profunda TaxID=1286698 RepID=UPI001CA6C168|nr:hypothetical protein [Crassaminicella profunda]QZY56669.1 hypothetical protein K7H06_07040 [Crassaminicella profunda]
MKNRTLDYYICPKCHNGGEYDITVPGFTITCCRCGYRDSHVRCDNCGVEGGFVKNISNKPHKWVCDYCGTINKLDDNFYRIPVKIPNSTKMKKSNTKKKRKSEFLKSTLLYLVLYCFILTTCLLEDSSNFDIWVAIKMLGATSGIFVASYVGLKGGSFRLGQQDRLKLFIERLHIPHRIIMTHICIFIVALLIVSFTDDGSSAKNFIRTEKIDQELITAIEKTFKRTDIKQIVKIDDEYIITFSDESTEVFEYLGE